METWGNFFTAPAKLCVWMPENAFFVSTTCTRYDNETSSLDCDKKFRVNLRHHHPAIVTCSSGWGRPSSLERQHHHPPNPPLCFESSILFTIFKSFWQRLLQRKMARWWGRQPSPWGELFPPAASYSVSATNQISALPLLTPLVLWVHIIVLFSLNLNFLYSVVCVCHASVTPSQISTYSMFMFVSGLFI